MDVDNAFRHLHRYFSSRRVTLKLPLIPTPSTIYSRVGQSEHSASLGYFKGLLPKNAAGYVMQYVRPFSQTQAEKLVKQYLVNRAQRAVSKRTDHEHFLAKVLLGGLRPPDDGTKPTLFNRPAYLDQLLQTEADVTGFAATMGASLAILHWRCGVDAAGVEWMLGLDSNNSTRLWLMDFGSCKKFEKTHAIVTTQLINAILHNQPYWPRFIGHRDKRNIWGPFREAYLQTSHLILQLRGVDPNLKLLAVAFMDEIEKVRGMGDTLD